ncbi:MAG: YtfJ family protein [Candidatus Neomarinimicrobiota bacterium]|jgi:hypothetical protein|nr:YtfJ family protein [Candidatus Neomarinimicrobiota bacterium]MDD3966472.1 YtfJ family protein [Candidatus Neomarinimicrobiota bacterium]MDX9779478.1 YtfJ family protein [bacterium]
MKKLLTVIIALIGIAGLAFAEGIVVGEKPVLIELEGKEGGRLDNTAWSSAELKETAWCLFYVDPDESDLNQEAEAALEAEDISKDLLRSVAVINYKATKLPAFAVSMVLKNKQKKYPGTVYLKDSSHAFVKQWGLTDDTYCVLVFDKNGVLVYRKDGKLEAADIAEYIATIKKNL